ncbi:MAG TPA: trypsin-like peptidase domain-containing protein [Tepidisphaeraceae bacterium]|nr:trypsin-like peptidase domain-containing protein [Tepidisphaeraceae bacterium]
MRKTLTARRLLAAVLAVCPAIALADGAAPPVVEPTAATNTSTPPKDKAKTPAVTGGTTPAARDGGQPYPSATPDAVVRVTAKIFPAVVRLDVAAEQFREGKRDLTRGIGSGVIIDAEGRILTNYHVAGRAAEIFVTLANKERIRAKLIGDDHWTDLAIVQLDMDEVKKRGVTFKFAELGGSANLIPGQDVMAIGTPHGFARTLTLGVVSNPDQTFYPSQLDINGYETGDFSNWIQMDTPINPGNSGGPLVDLNGYVVGINTRGGGQNLNFAVPVDTAKEVVAAILKSASESSKGKVTRSDLGVDLKPLQDLEAFYNIDINKGVLINSVERRSPAQKAGVKTSDILLELNGKAVNARFPEELAAVRKLIADLPVGEDVELTVRRGKETIKLKAQTAKLESRLGQEQEAKTWGLSVRDVTRQYANQAQLDDDSGVWITTLSPGYPAAKAELQVGDVIRSVNLKPVKDLDEFVKLYDASTKNKDAKVLIEVSRNRGKQTALLKVSY